MGNSVTSVHNSVTSACSSQCWYFAVASKECYAPKLQKTVTCVNRQANIHRYSHTYVIRTCCTDFWEKSIKICRYMYQFLRPKINPHMCRFLLLKIGAYGVSHLKIGMETLRSLLIYVHFTAPPTPPPHLKFLVVNCVNCRYLICAECASNFTVCVSLLPQIWKKSLWEKGSEPKTPFQIFFPENDAYELCLISAELCFI